MAAQASPTGPPPEPLGDVFQSIRRTIQCATQTVRDYTDPLIFEVGVYGRVGVLAPSVPLERSQEMRLRTDTGFAMRLSVPLHFTLDKLKESLCSQLYLDPTFVTLVLNGSQLSGPRTVRELWMSRPGRDAEIRLAISYTKDYVQSPIYSLMTLCPTCFAPEWNRDFRGATPKTSVRGRRTYARPVGWMRYGLAVKGVFPGGDDWLASDGRPGEWLVAYHGTTHTAVAPISEEGLHIGPRAAFGRGVYCTPNLDTAAQYAKWAALPSAPERIFRFIFQVRVNPAALVETALLPRHGPVDYWFVERECDIRPYGLLLQEG